MIRILDYEKEPTSTHDWYRMCTIALGDGKVIKSAMNISEIKLYLKAQEIIDRETITEKEMKELLTLFEEVSRWKQEESEIE